MCSVGHPFLIMTKSCSPWRFRERRPSLATSRSEADAICESWQTLHMDDKNLCLRPFRYSRPHTVREFAIAAISRAYSVEDISDTVFLHIAYARASMLYVFLVTERYVSDNLRIFCKCLLLDLKAALELRLSSGYQPTEVVYPKEAT